MKIAHLNYLKSISETHSFTESSRRLFLSQPALSDAIRKLEEEVGCRLLKRTSRGVYLTPTGEMVLRSADKVFQALDELDNTIQNVRAEHDRASSQTLKIGSTMTCNAVFLPRLIKKVSETLPGISWKSYQLSVRELEQSLESGDIQFAFFNQLMYDQKTEICPDRKHLQERSDFCCRRITSTPLVAVASKHHAQFSEFLTRKRISTERLMSLPLITTYAPGTTKAEIHAFFKTYSPAGKTPITHYFDALQGSAQAVLQGLGLFICPKLLAEELFSPEAREHLLFLEVEHITAYYDFFVSYPRKLNIDDVKEQFLRLLSTMW